MKIFPGMHYTMGGLWVDFKQATNIPGIYAAGECEYQYCLLYTSDVYKRQVRSCAELDPKSCQVK